MTLLVAISFRLLCLLSIMVPICPVTNILWQHRTFCRNINSLNQGCNQLTFKAGNNDCNLFYLTTVNFLAHSKCFLKFLWEGNCPFAPTPWLRTWPQSLYVETVIPIRWLAPNRCWILIGTTVFSLFSNKRCKLWNRPLRYNILLYGANLKELSRKRCHMT